MRKEEGLSESSKSSSNKSQSPFKNNVSAQQPLLLKNEFNYLGQPIDQDSLSFDDSREIDQDEVKALKSQTSELREGLLRFSVKVKHRS